MDTTQRQHIAETIRAARLRHGWGVGDAAERIGVTHPAWSRWESAHTSPSPSNLLALGDLFGLDEGWWEPPGATLSHPVSTVDINERLEQIEERQTAILDGIRAERERIEALYELLTEGRVNDDKRGQRGGGTANSDPRRAGSHRDR